MTALHNGLNDWLQVVKQSNFSASYVDYLNIIGEMGVTKNASELFYLPSTPLLPLPDITHYALRVTIVIHWEHDDTRNEVCIRH